MLRNRMLTIALGSALVALWAAPHVAQARRTKEEDSHALAEGLVAGARAAVLAKDFEQAETVIAELQVLQVKEEQEHGHGGELEVEILSLKGLVALQRNEHQAAAQAFEQVLHLRPTRTAVWLYLGQARVALGDAAGALDALQQGEDVGQQLPAFFLLVARCHRDLGQMGPAHEALERGLQRFPGDEGMLREEIAVLVELGLIQAALDAGAALVAASPDAAFPHLVLADALRRAGRFADAAEILEETRLRYPEAAQVTQQLAYVYARSGLSWQAARLFEAACAQAPELAFDAADQYRLVRRARDALRCNGQVPDAARRLSQRAAILTGAQRFDEALALVPQLQRAGALTDQVRPVLAQAALYLGELDLAQRLAEGVVEPALRPTAESVLRSVQRCRKRPEDCR